MVLTIIEIDGSETIVSCLTSYLQPEECVKYHRGMLGCGPDCPYLKKNSDNKKLIDDILKNDPEEQVELLYPEINDAKIEKIKDNSLDDGLYRLICYDECGHESLKLCLTEDEVNILSSAFYKISAFHQLFKKEGE